VNEIALIARIAKGENSALEALHNLYYPRLVRFLYRVTADKEHIVEIVNDVFFIIWKNAKHFRGESMVSTWILGIAYKKAIQSVSRRKPLLPLAETDPEPVD